MGWNKTQWLLHMNEPISNQAYEQIQADLAKLATHYPPQYLLGFAEFYGYQFKVTEDTLIPRPETEELVEKCLQLIPNDRAIKLVDIGTGTGAIALTLKKERPNWQISAVDLSLKALAVAKENAEKLQTTIQFYHSDCLSEVGEQFEVIVSNPPYISVDEWQFMDQSVREFEPKMALFAEKQGLAIYEKIAEQAKEKLTTNGKIFLEIGFQQGQAVQKIFQEAFPTKQVGIYQDLSGQDRMIIVQ
ncbi:protein-(glutamine-N5) methyltransferase, release factor-specific [Enterococcus columbae DSM 7374 = ATCC 51263]|nr:protein-(glutamine-N5) methyltransferase, release factor-specific [Enterococcus columbae DSM 7374 = ATCC 51263]